MGKEMFNTNPDLIDVDKDCRVLEIVQINQTLALNVTPMTAAKEEENVIPTPNWLRNHPACRGDGELSSILGRLMEAIW